MSISHDSVNRFLYREAYTPLDLFEEVRDTLKLKGGTLSVDDTVLDKPYSQYMELVGYFWSGKHHRSVKGVNLITVYYTDINGQHQPVNFRVYDKREGKTKNDCFQEMLKEVLSWGLESAFVTGDSWYSCVANLKLIRHHQRGLLFALESNRLVSVEKGVWTQVQRLEIPEEGLIVWLKEFCWVKLFRTRLKDQLRHYVVYPPNDEPLSSFGRTVFSKLHDQHWMIEQYHRTIKQLCHIKQVCHIEHFQVRGKVAIKNHLFAAICGYVQLQRLRAIDVISNCYRLQSDLFNKVIASFIVGFMPTMQHLNPQFEFTVNA